MKEKLFNVEGVGTVDMQNSIWIHCINNDSRDRMEIGDTCFLDFVSGSGKSTIKVTRKQ